MDGPKFVEMCTRNMLLRHPVPVGDEKVLIFDIDYCLFQSEGMKKHEHASVISRFLELSKGTEEEWYSHLLNFGLFRQIFYSLFGIHPSEFSRSYDIPDLGSFVKPDPELREMLEAVPLRKFCFINGCKERASSVLKYLQLSHVFEAVVCADVVETEFICKPTARSYKFVEDFLGISAPGSIFFFDDTLKNVDAARAAGWNAVHVASSIKDYLKDFINKC